MSRLPKSLLFLLILPLLGPSIAYGQSVPVITDPVTVRISPSFPRPDSTVTVTAQSFSTDLNRADFIWQVNGKAFRQGKGVTEISVPAGKSGIETTVDVNIQTTDSGMVTSSVSWRPAEVTLFWQSDGYVPPFYRGKALEAYGSSFKVSAVAEFFASGKRIDPKTLVYSWQKNGVNDAAQSGYGKDSYKGTQSSYIRGGDTINVEVATVDRSIGATAAVTISPTLPDVVLYEDSPLYGIRYESALSDIFELSSEEVTLRAEPFGMSITGPTSSLLSFDWTMNGENVPSFKNKNEITLRKTGAASGESSIGLLIQHSQKVLQGGQTGITILQ
jgi:hypothetical protein